MTNPCDAAREWMLEAEPAELRGETDSPFAAHLAACDACRGRARAILAGMEALDGGLAELARPRSTGKVIPLAPRRVQAWRVARWAAPLAAAAALALLLVRPPPPAGEPAGVTTERIAHALFEPAPVARAEGRSVAVLKTNDPAVTVVWVY